MVSTIQLDSWSMKAFKALDTEAKGYLVRDEILSLIDNQGVDHHHSLLDLITHLGQLDAEHKIDYDEFCKLTHGLFFLKRVLEWDLTIPHFDRFRHNLQGCYQKVKDDVNNEYSWGEVATYIPPLAKADPKWFATGFCSTDS